MPADSSSITPSDRQSKGSGVCHCGPPEMALRKRSSRPACRENGAWDIETFITWLLRPALGFLDLSTMRPNTIALPGLELGAEATNVFGVSPDDRSILLAVPVRSDVRLMLVRNFQ